MANTSDFLKLVLPQNGEYVDTWDQPLNDNLNVIDAWAKAVATEIADSRFGETSLKNFLQIAHQPDGSLKATAEVVKSRSSSAYGDENPDGTDFDLAKRLSQSDKEVLAAREGYSDLRSNAAFRSFSAGMVMDGAKDSNGYPTWLGSTGVNLQIDGSITPVHFMIGGFIVKTRKLEQLTIAGGVGTKQLYATYNPNGLIIVDGDSAVAPPLVASGTVGSDGAKIRLFEDLTVDFVTSGVKPGDVLEILLNGQNSGQYSVKQVGVLGNPNRLIIQGVFPGSAQASLNYTISDPFAVSFGYDDVQAPVQGKLYIGEADFDGTAITATRAMHFQDTFIGEWRAVDLSATASFTEIWNHKLFEDALDVDVQVSIMNDGSEPVEKLSHMGHTNSLSVANSLSLSAGAQVLSGSVSLSGSLIVNHSAKVRWTKTTVSVSNASANLLFKDFSGTDHQVGYVRVVVKKLRK